MDAKPGQVSPIMETQQNDQIVVIALKEIMKEGYTPLSNEITRANVEQRARYKKMSEEVLAKNKGMSLEKVAETYKQRVDTTDVTFGQMFVLGIGPSESQLVGQISATPVSGEVNGVAGNTAVYYYKVLSDNNQGRPYSFEENAARFGQQFGVNAVMQNIVTIMRDKNKVENNMLKFYSE
jgi:hypothetical protein